MQISVYSCKQQSIVYNGMVENARKRDSRMSTVNHFKEEIMFFFFKSERTAKINWILISKHFLLAFSWVVSTHMRCHDPTDEHRKLMAQPYFHLVRVKRRPFTTLVQNITTNTKYYLIVCILSLSLSLSFFFLLRTHRMGTGECLNAYDVHLHKILRMNEGIEWEKNGKGKRMYTKILQHKQNKRHEPPRSASHILFSI